MRRRGADDAVIGLAERRKRQRIGRSPVEREKDLAVGLKERAERIGGARGPFVIAIGGRRGGICRGHRGPGFGADAGIIVAGELLRLGRHVEILPSRWRRRIAARAAWGARKRVVKGSSVSDSVDLGGRGDIKKKKT